MLGEIPTISNPLDYHTFIWGDGPRTTDVFTTMLAGYDAGIFIIDPLYTLPLLAGTAWALATRNMAAALEDGRLVVVTAEGHTGYSPGICSGDVVDAYLVDPVGKAPADGFECS